MNRSVYLNTVINVELQSAAAIPAVSKAKVQLNQVFLSDERSLYSTRVVDLFTSSGTDASRMFLCHL